MSLCQGLIGISSVSLYTSSTDPDSTRTPLIAWGKSIRSSIPDTTPSSHDDYSRPWGPSLTQLLRVDLEQADVAALMAAVAGVNFPVNSVGVVPDVRGKGVGYLDVGMKEKAEVALGNAQVRLLLADARNQEKC